MYNKKINLSLHLSQTRIQISRKTNNIYALKLSIHKKKKKKKRIILHSTFISLIKTRSDISSKTIRKNNYTARTLLPQHHSAL